MTKKRREEERRAASAGDRSTPTRSMVQQTIRTLRVNAERAERAGFPVSAAWRRARAAELEQEAGR